MRDLHHNHRTAGRAHWTTPCQHPDWTSRHSIPGHAGHSAHCIESTNAKLHHNGPTFPRYTEVAYGHLHAWLLPAHAQPKWWLQWNRTHHAECWPCPRRMATHSTVIPISRERVRPLESHRGIWCICLLTSQPRPHRCTPIVGKRTAPSQGLSHWDGATHCNSRVAHAEDATKGTLYVLFGLVLGITPRTSKNKNEPPAARIYRQCNPKAIEVAFLTLPATEFFAEDQFQVLQDRYLARGHGLSPTVPTDAALTNFLLKDMWMFGITKSTSELTAVAQTPECRYHLGLGINNVQVAVNGMEGDKRSYLFSLCGQLLKQVLTPCHIATKASK